jgi:hypothetical protein
LAPKKELAALSPFEFQCHDGGYVNLTCITASFCDTIPSFLINFVPLFKLHIAGVKKEKTKQQATENTLANIT